MTNMHTFIVNWAPICARTATTVGIFAVMIQSSWNFTMTQYIAAFVALHFAGIAPTPAIFPVMYKLYCSKLIGYNFLRLLMHPRQPKAHSKWMCGVRYINRPPTSAKESPSTASQEMCVTEGEVLEVLRQAARDAMQHSPHVPVVVVPIAILADNYAYAVLSFVCTAAWKLGGEEDKRADVSIQCALVDPADPVFILEALSKLVGTAFLKHQNKKTSTDSSEVDDVPSVTSLVITHALTTHKHWDHAGGNVELAQASKDGVLRVKLSNGKEHVIQTHPTLGMYTEIGTMSAASPVKISSAIRMVGSAVDLPDATNVTVAGGDRVQLVLPPECVTSATMEEGGVLLGAPYVEVIESPGHTEGSVVFLVVAPNLVPLPSLTSSSNSEEASKLAKLQLGRSALFTGDCVFCGGCGAMFEVKKAEPVLQTYDAFHGDQFLVQPQPVRFGVQVGDQASTATKKKHHNLLQEGVINKSDSSTLFKGVAPNKLEPTEVLLYVGHEYTQRLFVDLVERSSKWEHSAPHYALAVSRKYDELIRLWKIVGDNACTVPSTLLCERRTNPLLSIERAVLLDLQRRKATSGDIERAVYLSENRRID